MAALALQNLFFYSVQVALLALAGGALLRLLSVRLPSARLICWQLLLAVCIILPAIQPWLPLSQATGNVTFSTGMMVPTADSARNSLPSISWTTSLLLVLVLGLTIRLAMLALGFWRLHQYRRRSRLAPGAFQELQQRVRVSAQVRISHDVAGPVTFGLFRPVILLPENCLENESVACHELAHVRRRDWPFAVLEESVLAVLWFHPAIWWMVAEIQLAREEAVDREVVGILNSREQYLESLLALAAARSGLDLLPASPFLRKRHLKKRVASLLKEVSMSRFHLNTSLAAFAAAVALVGWLSVKSFPLQAAPQEKADASGVTVQAGPVTLLHRAPVRYPRQALDKRIQGTVVVEMSLSESGAVTDARVLSGPEELRAAALQSMLQWHYSNDTHAPMKTQATVEFRLTPVVGGVSGGISGGVAGGIDTTPAPANGTVDRVVFKVPAELSQKLQSRINLHEGDPLTASSLTELSNGAAAVDEHLKVQLSPSPGQKGVTVVFFLDNPLPQDAPPRIRVPRLDQAGNLISRVTPKYPAEAKAARIQGIVQFSATISKEGKVTDLQTISGHPLLADAAREAVMQWVYRPVLLNGNPIEVTTQIDVNFSLVP